MNTALRIAVAVIVATTVVAPGTTVGAAPEVTRIKVVEPVSTTLPTFGVFNHTKALGLFKKHGLDVDVLGVVGSAAATKAVVAGEAVAAPPDYGFMLSAVGQGADLISVLSPYTTLAFVIASKAEIKSIPDLKGKVFGFSAPPPGGADYTWASFTFKAFGLGPPEKEVTAVAIGSPPDRVRALIAGRIDAALVSMDFLPVIQKEKGIHMLEGHVGKYQRNYPGASLILQRAFVEKNPETVKALIKAVLEANRLISRDQEALFTAQQAVTPGRYSKEDISAIWGRLKTFNFWSVNGGMGTLFEKTVFDVALGQLAPHLVGNPRLADSSKIFSRTILDEALKELGVIPVPWDPVDWRK